MNDLERGKVVAFLDVGTNSVRMLVVRINPNRSYTVISEQKEMVRLGEEFQEGMLSETAMERTVSVIKNFCDLSRTYGATEFVAMATSATREAANRMDLLDRVEEAAGLELQIISGMEEARLIYLGVSSGHHIGRKTALFVDIGGGSTELALGNQKEYSYLESLKVGAIRLTGMFVKRPEAPVPEDVLNKMRKYVKSSLVRAKREIAQNKVGMAFASSGTALNLGEMLMRQDGTSRPGVIRRAQLKKLVPGLAGMDLASRRRFPGMNPERADIIVAGAVILETVMDELRLNEIAISTRSMRDGMLIDYLGGLEEFPGFQELSVRERSVIQLGRACAVDEEHARRVTAIALELFDSAAKKGLHTMGKKERELLHHASFLHDVGDFISFNDHHLHSHYIISHAELLGFSSREVLIMANLAKYHRKRTPKMRGADLRDLDEKDQRTVVMLSTLLRMAESLDRSHSNLVQSVRFNKVAKRSVRLVVTACGDPQLEMWRIEEDRKAFKKAFGRDLVVVLNSVGE